MSGFCLYFKYLRVNLLSALQYRGWPIDIFNVFFVVFTDPLAVLLLFDRFGRVGDWTLERVMLVYGIAITAFGMAELFSRGFDMFPWLVRTGEFDRVLLRPRCTFLQTMVFRFRLNRVSRAIGGGGMMAWALWKLGVDLTPAAALQLLLALAGGYLTYTGVFIFASAVAFWTVQAPDWIYIFTNGSYQVAKCPPDLLPGWLKDTFIYIVPMLVFCYYPAAAACGWGVPAVLGWLALPAGTVFFALSLAFWEWGVRHYTSTGS
jgi:ABC-2 type transport system permease protein